MFSLQNKTYEECSIRISIGIIKWYRKNEKKKVLINSLNEIFEKLIALNWIRNCFKRCKL